MNTGKKHFSIPFVDEMSELKSREILSWIGNSASFIFFSALLSCNCRAFIGFIDIFFISTHSDNQKVKRRNEYERIIGLDFRFKNYGLNDFIVLVEIFSESFYHKLMKFLLIIGNKYMFSIFVYFLGNIWFTGICQLPWFQLTLICNLSKFANCPFSIC